MSLHPHYDLTKALQEHEIIEEFINPLPRAVLRPNTFLLLDGEWRFSLDMNDTGIQEGWHLGHNYTEVANWPGSIEQHIMMAKGTKTSTWNDKVVAWYDNEWGYSNKLIDLVQEIAKLK